MEADCDEVFEEILNRGGGLSGERAGIGGDDVAGEEGGDDESYKRPNSLSSVGGRAIPTRRERGGGVAGLPPWSKVLDRCLRVMAERNKEPQRSR